MRLRNFPRDGWCAAIFVLAALLAASAPAAARAPSPTASTVSVRLAIADCTNRERIGHGRRPLRESRPLRRAAQYHAANMLRYNFFSHDDVFGRGPSGRIAIFDKTGSFDYVGENIAAGYANAAEACHGWMTSAGHRANILDPHYTRIGIGFVSGDGGYGTYFVQDFGGGHRQRR